MFDSYIAGATNLASALPATNITVPFIGYINATPYLAALGIFLAIILFTKVVLVLILARLKTLSTRTATDIDDTIIDAVRGVRAWVYSLVAAYIVLNMFALPNWLSMILTAVVSAAVIWQVIEVLLCFVGYGTRRLIEKDEDGDGVVDPNAAMASDMINLLLRIVLYTFGFIFVLSNVGVEVTSLLAGLGIGGLAVAFALQGVLSDLFASFSIYFDKPFRIGDFIMVGQDTGTVERIGIKTTRLRTLQGEELVVSNAELTTARVQNFKKMEDRRIVTEFGITYETPTEQVKAVNGVVKEILSHLDKVELDRTNFKAFGDSALIFEVVYYIKDADYNLYMDLQEQFNFALLEEFAKRGIEFAYPTRTVYNKTVSGAAAA